MCLPMVAHGAEDKFFVEALKPGQWRVGFTFARLAPPKIDQPVRFSGRINLNLELFRRPGISPVGWDERAGSRSVKLEPVERALEAVDLNLPKTECRAPVRAFVGHHGQLACAVT